MSRAMVRRPVAGEITPEARDKVTTWADGFGLWHAVVPDGPDAPRRARAAIREELRARGDIGTGYRVRVTREPYTGAQARDGRAHYRETSVSSVHPHCASCDAGEHAYDGPGQACPCCGTSQRKARGIPRASDA